MWKDLTTRGNRPGPGMLQQEARNDAPNLGVGVVGDPSSLSGHEFSDRAGSAAVKPRRHTPQAEGSPSHHQEVTRLPKKVWLHYRK